MPEIFKRSTGTNRSYSKEDKKMQNLQIEKAVQNLLNNDKMQITELSGNLKDAYNIVSKADQKILDKILAKQYKPSLINSGTVAAFLFGCRQELYGDVNKECSPLCLANCEFQVLTKVNGKFLSNKNHNKKAYIFLEDDEVYFTSDEIYFFHQCGIVEAQVYRTRYNKHYIVIRMTNITNLPLINENKKNQALFYRSYTLIDLVILATIFIFILFLLLKKR